MQKNLKTKWDTRTIVFLGLLVALNIVLTRIVVIDLGSYRITIGNLCTVLAGLWFGPAGGAICGLIADLLGCLLKGYAINPLITVAAMLWGIVPALMRPLISGSRTRKTVMLCVSIVLTSILATLIFTTAGLVFIIGYNFFAIMPGRIAQWAIMTPIYCVLSVLLYFSPLTTIVMNDVVNHQHANA
jgi:ECF transporter S component (folate family)